jgi:hypothetical protein
MADQTPSPTSSPVTVDAFMADRQAFWSSFTGAVTIAAGAVALLVIGMAIFLV